MSLLLKNGNIQFNGTRLEINLSIININVSIVVVPMLLFWLLIEVSDMIRLLLITPPLYPKITVNIQLILI